MAVKQMTSITRYIGASTDAKPTDCPVGSTFYEYDTGGTYITYDGTNWVNFTEPGAGAVKVTLADDGSYTLPDASKGGCWFVIGDNEYWAVFTFATDGTTKEVAVSDMTNVVYTDTDGKVCILDTGTQVAIKNRLGSDKDLTLIQFAMP